MDTSLEANPSVKQLHNGLLAKLINEYVGHNKQSDSYVNWKMQFRNYCNHITQQNGSVLDNVYFLENAGLLDIGKYDVLQKMLSGDKEALSEIERVSKLIEVWDPSTITSADTNDYIVEIRIKVKGGCPAIEEILTKILSDFLRKLDYAYTSSKLDDFQTLSVEHPITICQRIVDGLERSKQYEKFAKMIRETRHEIKKFISFHNKDAERSSKIIIREFVGFFNRIKKKYCVQKWQIDWKEYTVIFVEFKNAFDYRLCLDSASLRKETINTFDTIFNHFNDVQHHSLLVVIREVYQNNKKQDALRF